MTDFNIGGVAIFVKNIHLVNKRKDLDPIRHGGGMMVPQNVSDHCAQTIRRRKLESNDL